LPWLIATPDGVTIAYSRNDAANGDAGRIFTRSLDALSTVSLPDLTVNGAVTATPNPVFAGDVVTVKYQIKNQGAGPGGPTTTNIAIKRTSDNALLVEREFATAGLDVGGLVDETRTVTLPTAGTPGAYTVYVMLDRHGALAQSNTANDTSSAPLSVLGPPDCTYTFDRSDVTVPSGGGSGSIQVAASDQACAWTVTIERGGEWLTIRSGGGTGNGSITFTAAKNPSATEPRSAVLVVGGARVTINQGRYTSHRRSVGH
jgi:hypothetical protein